VALSAFDDKSHEPQAAELQSTSPPGMVSVPAVLAKSRRRWCGPMNVRNVVVTGTSCHDS